MKPRVITEFDECERPGLLHAVRRADADCIYVTMCGETLYSDAKKPSFKRGIPQCLRCMVAMCEEAVLWI